MSQPKPSAEPWSRDFDFVLTKELNRIFGETREPEGKATVRAHEKRLLGLAFSGGGIRSATFQLGVLQALARMKLLPKVDYLSTVSGGGYIGSWLMAWIKNAQSVTDVHAGLHPEWGQQPGHREPREIHFLRQYSNYLTPKLGWLGADTWTVVAIYVRNLLLNLIILGSALAVVLLIPRWVVKGSFFFWHLTPPGLRWIWLVVVIVLLAGAIVAIVYGTRYFGARSEAARRAAVETKLETVKGAWQDSLRQPLILAGASGPTAWHRINFFDNFVLRLQFKMSGGSVGRVYLWHGAKDEVPVPADAEAIYLADPALLSTDACLQIGKLNGRMPVRLPTLKPKESSNEWNDLEIICSKQRCTVRINHETINSDRMKQWAAGGPRESSHQYEGAIGLERRGIEFQNIEVEGIESSLPRGGTQRFVEMLIVMPLFLAAFTATFLLDYGATFVPWPWWWCALLAGGVSALLVVLARAGWLLAYKLISQPDERLDVCGECGQIGLEAIWIALAAGLGGIALWALHFLFSGCSPWEVSVWGTPAIICAFFGTLVLYVGLLGRSLPDERREWWSRLSALLIIGALGWIAIFGTAFYAPVVLEALRTWWTKGTIAFGWIASTVSGLIAARSASTGAEKSNKAIDLIAKVAPYIFVAGFFIFLSVITNAVVAALAGATPQTPSANATLGQFAAHHWQSMDKANHFWPLLWATLAPLGAALLLSRQLDINHFSMHMLYRNRLGRCYLGASNRFRQAQPFTGFSSKDDFPLAELERLPFSEPIPAPYPIINASLNLVGGKELAWQQRKAASFVFTPLYCGYDFPELPPGYCPTDDFAGKPSKISLATAMAISGAAASPNMGYHTSPAPAFLMTVFNVRLGWWLGNPRTQKTWQRSGPLNVLLSLIRELFGLTSETGSYIYLSDGGHFENLGIYELVRRRCRFIIASDAEEDHAFAFGGLGNAIEKCRADFGVEIEIDVEPIRQRSAEGYSRWHCAIGHIHYSEVDDDARDGILVYLKSSLTGDEPTDVLRYAAENREFPHQSTGDQWFDESQFESYRALGCHIAERVFGVVDELEKVGLRKKEELFVDLAQSWYPPSSATSESFTKHTRALVAIYDELRNNKHLGFLSTQIYPEWEVLFKKSEGTLARLGERIFPQAVSKHPKSISDQLPSAPAQLQAGFYLCNSMCQLMEDVYIDLNLEQEFNHPDNCGWMNLFQHWSWAPMFRVSWTISASTYGARFQTFCKRHLNLIMGETSIEFEEFDPKSLPQPKWEDILPLNRLIKRTLLDWRIRKPALPEVLARVDEEVNTILGRLEKHVKLNPIDVIDGKDLKIVDAVITKALSELEKAEELPETDSVGADEEWEWLAVAVLQKLVALGFPSTHGEVTAKAKEIARHILLRSCAILRRRGTAVSQALNLTECDLTELFFVYNPRLISDYRIFRFDLIPGYHVTGSLANVKEQKLKFPIGFALVADYLSQPKLVYFRIQDHLRRIGLARAALRKLIGDKRFSNGKELKLDLKEMHPDAHEVPTGEDREEFERLFDSVKTALEQEGPAFKLRSSV